MADLTLHGMLVREHHFTAPLDHSDHSRGTISLYGREVVEVGKKDSDLPWLVFLQGGPGFAAPRPTTQSGWLKRAVREFRVLLLDTRGNGNSTPVLAQTLLALPDDRARASYLARFRADAIVEDCELIRKKIAEGAPWSLLGQSYGGFCAVRYLSARPEGLREVFIAGGLPPLDGTAEEYYQETYGLQIERNRRWRRKYPGDGPLAARVMGRLREREVALPTGGRLTPERFQTVGLQLGFSDGCETIHYLLEQALVGGGGGELSYPFLRAWENLEGFQSHPIYALLHEACYAQGAASNWAAHRVRGEFPEFNWTPGREVWLTGEMVYPWLFEQLPELRPLRGTAELLAEKTDWPPLYDPEALARRPVPGAAVIYLDDPFVPRRFSEQTARALPGLAPWITNEYDHDGLRVDGERILDRLIALARG